jgi:hypothetical protein
MSYWLAEILVAHAVASIRNFYPPRAQFKTAEGMLVLLICLRGVTGYSNYVTSARARPGRFNAVRILIIDYLALAPRYTVFRFPFFCTSSLIS